MRLTVALSGPHDICTATPGNLAHPRLLYVGHGVFEERFLLAHSSLETHNRPRSWCSLYLCASSCCISARVCKRWTFASPVSAALWWSSVSALQALRPQPEFIIVMEK